MFLVVCYTSAAWLLVFALVWYFTWPAPLPVPLHAALDHRINRAGLGELQGVLSVQHQRRISHNRNSDVITDTLTVTINHRNRNNLQSSECTFKMLNLHATQPSIVYNMCLF